MPEAWAKECDKSPSRGNCWPSIVGRSPVELRTNINSWNSFLPCRMNRHRPPRLLKVE